jgi:pilus assembly protein Flp/PilA
VPFVFRLGPAHTYSDGDGCTGLAAVKERYVGTGGLSLASPTLAVFHNPHEGAQMNRIRTLSRNFLKSDEGIAVTEYGLLVALVAVLLIGVVTIFGSSIRSWFAARTSTITTV